MIQVLAQSKLGHAWSLLLCVYCGQVTALYMSQYCGKQAVHTLPPNTTTYTSTHLRCVARCARYNDCAGVNYVTAGSDVTEELYGVCQVYLYDTLSPCDLINQTSNGGYWIKKVGWLAIGIYWL